MIRALDLVFSFLGLMLALPVFIVLFPLLRLTGEGEIFYRQTRIGLNGARFSLLKFATMLKNSPNLATGDITIRNDTRILKIGKFLRATKLNELPQIWNIFNGDMSIVGPRPMTEKNFSYYDDPARQAILSVRPGLTGIGSIVFRDEENILDCMEDKVNFYMTVIAPYKGELEKWYVKNANISTYFATIFFTALAIIRPKSQLYRSYFKDLPIIPAALRQEMEK